MIEQLTPTQLVEVLCKEQRQHWRAGLWVPTEAYLRQHPTLESDPQCVLELVYNEVLLREQG